MVENKCIFVYKYNRFSANNTAKKMPDAQIPLYITAKSRLFSSLKSRIMLGVVPVSNTLNRLTTIKPPASPMIALNVSTFFHICMLRSSVSSIVVLSRYIANANKLISRRPITLPLNVCFRVIYNPSVHK